MTGICDSVFDAKYGLGHNEYSKELVTLPSGMMLVRFYSRVALRTSYLCHLSRPQLRTRRIRVLDYVTP